MIHTNLEIAFLLLLIGAVVSGLMRSWRAAGWMASLFVAAAAVLALLDGIQVIASGQPVRAPILVLPGFGSELAIWLDPLGAGFLLLIATLSLVATIYSIGYMQHYTQYSPRRFYLPLLFFIAMMMGVVCVRDWLFFLVFWELMTLASYFLVTFERGDPTVMRAGFKYFVMTHVASAGLLIAAIVLWCTTGSFSFDAQTAGLAAMSAGLQNFLLGLYLLAFATKAGIFPMGDWLPDAHPVAPSGVSAILSGVMIKLGAYGVLRVFWQALPGYGTRSEVMTWGVIIAALGTLSAFVGGVTAMRENDCKRLLAFSSIGQTGYIFLALGIAISFANAPALLPIASLALIGAGFHMLNDAIYKSLLFMGAGSVYYASGTRDLSKVGGLAAVMPVAAGAALIGVLSLSGLPPTNGFASKWVIYQSSISAGMQFAPFLVMAVIAFFASLSTLAYSLKFFYGTAFLGAPSPAERPPIPLAPTMTFAQGLLAVVCLAIGLAPILAVRAISSVFQMPHDALYKVGSAGGMSTVPGLHLLSAYWNPIGLAIALVVCFLIAEWIRSSGRAKVRTVPNWYCGEEHAEEEVRFRAQDFYSPFNEVFARVYPHLPLPRLPGLKKLRSLLDFDSWLYDPLVKIGGRAVNKVSRSHVGTPQLYMIWQVGGMVIVLALLVLIIR